VLRRLAEHLGILLLGLPLTGCFGGENHWAHYAGGGMFDAGPPAMSPDGSTVIYATPCSGRGDIVRVNRDGTGRAILAGSDDFEAHPIYSLDGKKIIYVREHDGDRHIWIMNGDGTGQTPLTSGRVMDDLVGFSADGSKILFDRSLRTGGRGRFPEPYSMRIDGQGLKRSTANPAGLVKDGMATPDGTRIYFTSHPYAHDLCVKNADGTGERIIPTLPGYKLPPQLSHDGRTLLLGVYTGNKRHPDVALIDMETEKVLRLLSEDCGSERSP
jgi:Tol biopolymer transport system component